MSTTERRVVSDHPAPAVTRLSLNRPAARNALDRAMVDTLLADLATFADDDEQRVLILTGNGPAFCAGGDLAEMTDIIDQPAGQQRDYLWTHLQRIPRCLASLDKPVIAAVNGAAFGAGMDLALMADLRLASDGARFASSYINLGLAAGDGGAWFMTRLIGIERSLDLLWSGRTVQAAEAQALGLVGRIVAADELQAAAVALAQRLAAQPSTPVRMMKRAVYGAVRSPLDSHLDLLASHMAVLYDSAEFRERLARLSASKS